MSLKDDKPILRFNEQLEKLNDLGIYVADNEIHEAKNILSNHNYFFKLLAYRKNYDKNEQKKYNISFLSIVDLAKLDMQLRYVLLPYCLDIEHSLKTYLMRLITNRKNKNGEYAENGYEIVKSVLADEDTPKDLKDQIFNGVRYRDSDGNLAFQEGFEKYYNEPPIWVVLDLASISKIKFFVNYLANKQPNNNNLKMIKNNIGYVSYIRNSCAHNKPILLNLQRKSIIKNSVYANARRIGITHDEITNLNVARIFALFELHRIMCSEGMRSHRNKDFSNYLERVNKTLELHEQNMHIKNFFNSFRLSN